VDTVRLDPEDRFLYVSCRGPNNPESYELPSPANGSIHVIDAQSLRTVEVIPGGNQPTGLGITPDGRFLAFSNFQDRNVEIYAIRTPGAGTRVRRTPCRAY
jgi:6-phosphogluconolactonase (cycloisomerase 2 family)